MALAASTGLAELLADKVCYACRKLGGIFAG